MRLPVDPVLSKKFTDLLCALDNYRPTVSSCHKKIKLFRGDEKKFFVSTISHEIKQLSDEGKTEDAFNSLGERLSWFLMKEVVVKEKQRLKAGLENRNDGRLLFIVRRFFSEKIRLIEDSVKQVCPPNIEDGVEQVSPAEIKLTEDGVNQVCPQYSSEVNDISCKWLLLMSSLYCYRPTILSGFEGLYRLSLVNKIAAVILNLEPAARTDENYKKFTSDLACELRHEVSQAWLDRRKGQSAYYSSFRGAFWVCLSSNIVGMESDMRASYYSRR